MVSQREGAEMVVSGRVFRYATSIFPIFVRWNAQNRQHDFVRIFRNFSGLDERCIGQTTS
jgi:hypothetical protein